jgi:uncharacterized membrane protein YiaA
MKKATKYILYIIMPPIAMLLYFPISILLNAAGYFFAILIILCPFVRVGCFIYEKVTHKKSYRGI